MEEFKNRVALISGAAGNMGQAVAVRLAQRGVRLALLDLRQDRLEQSFGDLERPERHLLLGNVDATDRDSIEAAVRSVETRFDRIDFLLNITGGYRAGNPVHETPIEEWEIMMNLNARSAFLLSRAVLPGMLRQKFGKIVNIGAKPGLKGIRNAAAYSAAKAAVLRLTESLAAEVRASGINVNAIVPGSLDTPQNRLAMPDADPSAWVSLAALTDVILFLLSSQARAVHGAAIIVDGPETANHG
jgi:NAD(P)-dependent dehydrogenase (short-subunit alcohol dehydrogenase family)